MFPPQFDCFATIARFGHNGHVVLPADCRRQALEDKRVIVRNQKPDLFARRYLVCSSRRDFSLLLVRRNRILWGPRPRFHSYSASASSERLRSTHIYIVTEIE